MNKPFWKTRTFWGTFAASVFHVVFSPPEQRAQAAGEGLGAVIAAVGVRDAISKNGTGQ